MRTNPWVRAALVVGSVSALSLGASANGLTPVPSANTRVNGEARPNVLSVELTETIAAQGSNALENPTSNNPFYGYDGDGPMLPLAGDVQSDTHNVEATKTEPDKNTYLVLDHVQGADPNYDYGHHFLFQGHELSVTDSADRALSFISRINLDADGAHRVTLLADHDTDGNPISTIDGSTWNPFAQRLLFTTEDAGAPSVYQATLGVPSSVVNLTFAFGHAGYEGIQNDANGNVWLVEDQSGAAGALNKHAKQPNSFVYRFVPKDPRDLTKGGKLQVLQLQSLANPGQPIVFHPGQADADILSQDVKDEHTYGKVFRTKFITIHDNATDGTGDFNANDLAKAAGGTPFKRPENGVFRPGSKFTQFFFSETGDTNVQTEAGSDFGGFGGIFRLSLTRPNADTGTLSIFYNGDVAHTGLDNCNFLTPNGIVFVEDAGAGVHQARNGLDSAYLFDVRTDFSQGALPTRILAQGRDASSTLDASLADAGHGFQNEDDNEITGFHVSDGDPGVNGILGAKLPIPFVAGWRVFYTQQHGDNYTWEVVPARPFFALFDGN
ncbi:MAG TPA: alkaline phosphatase PhoX [Myxococcota bacterium]|nr:alkaline phosphatase PhoX [Myxococcota bacterium]